MLIFSSALHPKFSNLLSQPDLTIRDLITKCQIATPNNHSAKGQQAIYVRVYILLNSFEDVAIYVGWTKNFVQRQNEHDRGAKRSRSCSFGPGKPTHYDVAKLAKQRHVLVLAIDPGANLNRDGTPMAGYMLEQTLMLLLKSYVRWLFNIGLEGRSFENRASLLIKIDEQVRKKLGFYQNWNL